MIRVWATVRMHAWSFVGALLRPWAAGYAFAAGRACAAAFERLEVR